MTNPSEASVVPVSLTLGGRTGHTIWAAPWVEDGEEWQAFLGARGRVYLFEDTADLAGFLAGDTDHDLSDHPSALMLRTLPADQLGAEPDYRFDLDGIPALTEREVDDDVVMAVGDTIDMARRIAECCEHDALVHLLESPVFLTLLDEEPEDEDEPDDEDEPEDSDDEAELADEDADDDAWAEIGAAVRRSWPLVLDRLDRCLRWIPAGESPEVETDGDDDDLTPSTETETIIGG